MSIFKKLFQSKPESHVDLESRRRFLRGAAGLAAVAVVLPSTGGIRLLTETETDRLLAMVKSGLVENHTFYLDRTAVLCDLRDVVFRNCRFIAADGFVGDMLLHVKGCERVTIESCHFDTNGQMAGISFKPAADQEEGKNV